ncbi:MAG: hypothetical protein QXR60_02750 [Candidatus Nanoarchaeia archaeon]
MNNKGSVLLTLTILVILLIIALLVFPLLSRLLRSDGDLQKVFGGGAAMADNISITSMSPGSTSTITQDGNRIDVDYTGVNAVIKLNGKVIWEGNGRKLECRATSTGLVLKVDGKQIWPKE